MVEILYFDGCPNHEPSVALVERIAAELGLQPEIRLVNVPDPDAAARLRFLGSPTVRIGGRDIEPGAEQRTDFALSCRVFQTDWGFSGEPDERWVRDALLRERAVPSEISAARPLEASRPFRRGARGHRHPAGATRRESQRATEPGRARALPLDPRALRH
jgi:hypothetical protein